MSVRHSNGEAIVALAKATDAIVKAWPDHSGFSGSGTGAKRFFSAEAERVSTFFDMLGVDDCTRFFALTNHDFRHLTVTSGSEWRWYCLNDIRAKIAIHLKAAVESLASYGRLGYWSSRKIPNPREYANRLREILTWMGLYSQNNLRQQQASVRDGRFDNVGEISSIDPELFTACNLIETSAYATDQVRQAAHQIIGRTLESNLFNVTVSAITDSANLWWAVKLAIANEGILEAIPGSANEPLVKAANLVSHALLKPMAFPPNTPPHPLDYTPEIYRELRTYCFVLINLLEIQRLFARNPAFRRSSHLWYVLSGTDQKINECWAKLREQSPRSLNLYLLATLNKAYAHWLAYCRTDGRWTELKKAIGIRPHGGKLSCTNVLSKIAVKSLNGLASHNEAFCDQLSDVFEQMKAYVVSKSFRRPVTIALCGPPGAGKTFIAQTLISALDRTTKGQALNLANNWPDIARPWIDNFRTAKRYWSGTFRSRGNYQFQAVIIDEADSLDPKREQPAYAYQWLLAPLWDKWPRLEAKPTAILKKKKATGAGATAPVAPLGTVLPGSGTSSDDSITTFVFVIASKFETWSEWHAAALLVNKGKDFVSRVDHNIDIPSMGPEDQLVLAASQFQAENVMNLGASVAKAIALGRFEHEGRSIESMKKQCDLKKARAAKCLAALPERGPASEGSIRLLPN